MKFLPIIIVCSICSGCVFTESSENPIGIIGRDIQGHTRIEGRAVCIGTHTLLTSAHVVSDDRLTYTDQDGTPLDVITRDITRDRATLRRPGESCPPQIWNANAVGTGEIVSVGLYRSGSYQISTGRVLAPRATVLGYSTSQPITAIHDVVVVDREFLPGDSGSPIVNSLGEVVDVVHVGK